MIFKDILNETRNFMPNPMIRYEFLDELSPYIPDECIFSGRIIELGANHGGFTIRLAYMAKKYNLKNIIAVDIWDSSHRQANMDNISDESYNIFIQNINNNFVSENIDVIKMDSSKYGNIFNEEIALLFIDADHYYDGVVKDLLAWKNKVMIGGIIYMDDFGPWGGTPGPEGACFDVLLNNRDFEIIYRNHTFCLIKRIK